MPITFEFNKSTEILPPHDAEVIYVDSSPFYSTYEFKFAQVEWQWDFVDEEGHPTGSSCTYEPGEEQPEGSELIIIVDGRCLDKDGKIDGEGCILWALCDAVDQVLTDAGV